MTAKPKLIFVDEPPPSLAGHPALWPERLESLLDHPGKWVDATATWGTKQGSVTAIRAHAARLELSCEAISRRVDGDDQPHVFVMVR